jgi:hypothetical protein
MIVTAIILAALAAVCDHFFGIDEPWRKIIWAGIIVLLVVGIILLIFPGVLPVRVGWY